MDWLRNENDFYVSLEKALGEIDKKWKKYPGLIISGTHAFSTDVEAKLEAIRNAREKGIPALLICGGMQLGLIEYARNVLGLVDANSTEINPQTTAPIITELSEMRVGIRPVTWRGEMSMESHWHKYALNNAYLDWLNDWEISFTDAIAEVVQLKNHPHFLGIQWHPEYQSSKNKPHPIIKEFLLACRK